MNTRKIATIYEFYKRLTSVLMSFLSGSPRHGLKYENNKEIRENK